MSEKLVLGPFSPILLPLSLLQPTPHPFSLTSTSWLPGPLPLSVRHLSEMHKPLILPAHFPLSSALLLAPLLSVSVALTFGRLSSA